MKLAPRLRSEQAASEVRHWRGKRIGYRPAGHNEIVRLREEARGRLGADDFKGFHDTVLLSVDMPLEALAGRVSAWT
jgi:uncharacterized protein (DUF885 family)